MNPGFFALVPPTFQPLVQSSVVVSIVAALVLNGIFRIGVTRTVKAQFSCGPDMLQKLHDFIQRSGGAWAARQEIMQRVTRATQEFAELAPTLMPEGEAFEIEASFDEFNLDVLLYWRGHPFEVATTMPTAEEMLLDEDATARLASFLIARAADRIDSRLDEDGRHRLRLHFDH
jgi:NCS2 family nucleobase:cation symporter-2